MPQIRVSIIIVSYKNMKVLQDCLNSIKEFNDIGNQLETIVVEQSEDPSMIESIRKGWPWVRVVEHSNHGFGAGNNCGIIEARGDYYLLLNPDTVLIEPVFKFAISRFESDSSLGIFGVRLTDRSKKHNRSFSFRKPYGLIRSIIWRICDRVEVFFPRSMYIAGADMFIRAEAFKKTGGFDERMFLYYEETYICKKMNDDGYRVGYYPKKSIIHLEGKSSMNIDSFRYQVESLKYLCQEYGWNYREVLAKMRRDRWIKQLLGQDRSAEISVIDQAISH